MTYSTNHDNLLNQPLELPCGAVIKNRLVKSAMSDSLGNGEGDPTNAQIRLYERWAEGGLGLSIIGEVQVDPNFPEKPGNLVLSADSDLNALHSLASRASINGAHIWPQLGHAGGLSYTPISHPKGPSALNIDGFQCAGMSETEVSVLPDIYARAAVLAKDVGFTGVQIHAGHGFLLSQFLSPLFNRRKDQYGGTIEARCRIIVEIIAKVRSVVGAEFPIGIKINSSDQLEGGLTQEDALEAIRILDKTSIDLIELSGGSYFPGAISSSDCSTKGPYFIDFAKKAKNITSIPLVVTGGFKTRGQSLNALTSNSTDFVGLARALVLDPELPNDWLSGVDSEVEFPRFETPPQGGITAWYTMYLTAIGNDNEKK
ncbi:NADH:flavin oxidoreductase/NADH oxidase family protein [Moritella dasanensis]|uniref:NADH:flavin oxidoreductase/NADH oxidase family protein n=1 Tax=Moritella dasanensis TaxID=428031 RepID=UPI000306D00F|nr:NADH:flavin oxidoreductase/NADH oxidase family protein [Moritella dasanensis]